MKAHIKDALMLTFGVSILAAGINLFLLPNEISSGGFGGIATILNVRLGFPMGITVAALNLPLAILALKFLGSDFSIKTIIAVALYSLMLTLIPLGKNVTHDPIIACVYGGAIVGLGIGMVIRVNATTGGSELMAMLLKLKYRNLSVGKLIFIIDFFVIAASGIFISPEGALYAIGAVFISTQVVDMVVSGFGRAKAFLIISKKNGDIAGRIMDELKRGVTSLSGRGMYKQNETEVLLCVVQGSAEVASLQSIVSEIDTNAFLIQYGVHEVMGEGFKKL